MKYNQFCWSCHKPGKGKDIGSEWDPERRVLVRYFQVSHETGMHRFTTTNVPQDDPRYEVELYD